MAIYILQLQPINDRTNYLSGQETQSEKNAQNPKKTVQSQTLKYTIIAVESMIEGDINRTSEQTRENKSFRFSGLKGKQVPDHDT